MDTIIISTPIGEIMVVADDQHIIMIDFVENDSQKKNLESFIPIKKEFITNQKEEIIRASAGKENIILSQTAFQLSEYFAGTRRSFTLPLAPHGTEFQKKAWKTLQEIPYGETRNYREHAELAGNPKAVRAIGGANNKNPIVILIPCHRVIGKSGKLVGYSGGINRKIWLLDHEKKYK